MLHAAACRCVAERPLGRALSSRRAGRRPLGAWSVFGFAARVRRAAARVIAESFGGKWLVETRDAAVLGLGLEQAVVEAQGLAAWSWACRVRWGVEGRRGREAGRLSARACWLVSAHGFLFFCLFSARPCCGAWWSCGRVGPWRLLMARAAPAVGFVFERLPPLRRAVGRANPRLRSACVAVCVFRGVVCVVTERGSVAGPGFSVFEGTGDGPGCG